MKKTGLQLRDVVHTQGFRLTPQRQMILDAVRELGGHCTPDAVYAQVQRYSTAVNRATVYRNLEFLLQLGLVTTTHLRNNQTVYELVGSAPHHHLLCQACGHMLTLEHAPVQKLFAQIERGLGFKVTTNHLALFGLCKQCQGKERS